MYLCVSSCAALSQWKCVWKLNRELLLSHREGALTSELCIFVCHRVQHCVSGNVWEVNRELLLSQP